MELVVYYYKLEERVCLSVCLCYNAQGENGPILSSCWFSMVYRPRVFLIHQFIKYLRVLIADTLHYSERWASKPTFTASKRHNRERHNREVPLELVGRTQQVWSDPDKDHQGRSRLQGHQILGKGMGGSRPKGRSVGERMWYRRGKPFRMGAGLEWQTGLSWTTRSLKPCYGEQHEGHVVRKESQKQVNQGPVAAPPRCKVRSYRETYLWMGDGHWLVRECIFLPMSPALHGAVVRQMFCRL